MTREQLDAMTRDAGLVDRECPACGKTTLTVHATPGNGHVEMHCASGCTSEEIARMLQTAASAPLGDPEPDASSEPVGALTDEKGRWIAPKVAAYLLAQTPAAIGGQFVHTYRDGHYQPGERDLARRISVLAGDNWTRRLAAEVIENIRAGAPDLDDRPPIDRINLRNGIYHLDTGELTAHTPRLLSPVQLPVVYDPDAECPAISAFLENTLEPDVATLFVEVAGYLLTPDNRHQRAILLKGPNGNGKTTALEILAATVGRENVSRVALQQLDEHRFATAQLYGKLANIHADLPSRAVHGTSAFKCITGGDPIMAEHKGRDPFAFTAWTRFVFSANETPPTHDGTEAYFARWTILPFTRSFRGANCEIKNLSAKLTTPAELSGFLNLALATIPRVRAHGFTIGDAVQAEHEQFRLDSDPVAAFLDERCHVDTDARTARGDVYRAYQEWCHDTGRKPLNAQRFTTRVRERYAGVITEPKVQGHFHWGGLRLTGASS